MRITKFLEMMKLCEARIRKQDLKYHLRNRSYCGGTAFQMCEKIQGKT